jgi:hypothetical protein
MILVTIGIILFIASVISNYRANSFSVKVYFNSFEQLTYNFGVSSAKFVSKDSANPHILSIISLGLVVMDVEVHFIRKINLEEN